MDESEKELIRQRTDIVELISGYTALKRSGANYKGLCPFHSERTPSFHVMPESGRWRCYGACGIGGDAFSFLEKAENLTFMEAAERLAERAGITIRGKGDSEESRRQKNERDRIYAANAVALDFFRMAFDRSTLAQQYATKRGLILETRQNFGIGYAPDDWEQLARYLVRQKIHPQDAIKAGLISPSRRGDDSYIDRFRGRLMFPIVDVQERVVAFGGRLIVDKPDAPKYLNSPETPVFSKSKILYALNRGKRAIMEKKLAVIVEGYMDAVAAHQAGIPYVVATLGTALTEEHVKLLRRYVGEKGSIALSFDADKAGVNAALKAAELIDATGGGDFSLRVLSLPPGEDPDSLIASGRVDAFHRSIDNAVTVPEFRLRSLENVHNINSQSSESDRMAYLREAIEVIAAVPSVLEQDRLVRLAAVHHPSFANNSLRAEELIRQEVAMRSQQGKTGMAVVDDTANHYPRQQNGYGGNSGGYRGNGQQGNGNGYSGNGGRNGRNGNRKPWVGRPAPQVDMGPPPQAAWNATETAERTLTRAVLSDEWVGTLVRRLTPEGAAQAELPPFASETVTRLFDQLWPLILTKIPPRQAVRQLVDPEVSEFVDTVLLAEGEPELSDAAIDDALRQLRVRSLNVKKAEIRAVLTGNGEGTPEMDDETLRRWSQIARTLRAKGAGQPSDEDP